ncbi:hypothetical protein ACI3L1_09985 [Deinococcus sp. SM5_A1]|uniref:hypothetical protein n=1 Tax=Deinococcus sp. SM5_A1 TaxID=3379094 RepID=UPI00385C540D
MQFQLFLILEKGQDEASDQELIQLELRKAFQPFIDVIFAPIQVNGRQQLPENDGSSFDEGKDHKDHGAEDGQPAEIKAKFRAEEVKQGILRASSLGGFRRRKYRPGAEFSCPPQLLHPREGIFAKL